MKVCKKCNIEKRKDSFYKSKNVKDGRENVCIDCRKKRYQERLEEEPDFKRKAYMRTRGKHLESKKEYYKNNKSKIRKSRREYEKKRRKEDINYRISMNLRRRINHFVKGTQKGGSSIKDLGCTVEEFILYIESQFSEDMSWDNYGVNGWHIDHITPLSKFDLTDREQFLEACNYTNMQPLWAKDNLSKSNKISFEWEY